MPKPWRGSSSSASIFLSSLSWQTIAPVDGTATVLEQWRERVRRADASLAPLKNLGISRNFVDALANCRGQYVAILEGDDYWTDSRKLQMQHDFLAANPDYSACFHRVKLQLDDGRIIDWTPLPGSKPRMEFREVLVENFVPGCSSLMFRNDPRLTFPDWLFEVNYYDWLLNVANAELGNAAIPRRNDVGLPRPRQRRLERQTNPRAGPRRMRHP